MVTSEGPAFHRQWRRRTKEWDVTPRKEAKSYDYIPDLQVWGKGKGKFPDVQYIDIIMFGLKFNKSALLFIPGCLLQAEIFSQRAQSSVSIRKHRTIHPEHHPARIQPTITN